MGEHTLSIWPSEDVNISSLAVQICLVPSLFFLFLFPKNFTSLHFLHHFLLHVILSLKLSLISILPFMIPSFDALKTRSFFAFFTHCSVLSLFCVM